MVLINSICSLAMIFPLLLAADGTAPLEVHVVDPQGHLPGATIRLLTPGSEAKPLLTDKDGKAKFVALPCDRLHSFEFSFPAYPPLTLTEIDVCKEAPVLLTICLDEGVTETIVFRCGPGPVNIEKTHVSNIYSAQFLQDLPGSRGHSREMPPKRKKGERKRCEKAITITSSSSTP